jgi:hypothetical protein
MTASMAQGAGGSGRNPALTKDDGLAARVAAALAEIEAMDIHGLRARYRKLHRKGAPEHLPKWLLLRIVAYRIQADAYGDLDKATVKLLDAITAEQRREREARAKAIAAGKPVPPKRAVPLVPTVAPERRFRPGTELHREHDGLMHRVMVMEEGYAWNGKPYRSLSEVARAITGTNWNGPRFFGLRPKAKPGTGRTADETELAPAPSSRAARRRHCSAEGAPA